MQSHRSERSAASGSWRNLGRLEKLDTDGRQVVKIDGRQIAVFRVDEKVFAINNHCPHEGFPLIEGTVKDGCRLACNWHSWTFDLATGNAEVGRDPVRRYEVEDRDGEIWINLSDPSEGDLQSRALTDLDVAVGEYDYDRMARCLARYTASRGELNAALTHVIAQSPGHLERGMTHGFATGADWLAAARIVDPDMVPGGRDVHELVPALEFVAHLSDDMLHSADSALPSGETAWDGEKFLRAIENQDEGSAIPLLRGAFSAQLTWSDIEPVFVRAALSHYHGFGHGLIYVQKTGELIAELGEDVVEPLAFLLARYLTVASREDLIPEFRALAPAIAEWDESGNRALMPDTLSGQSTRKVLELSAQAGGDVEALFKALIGASALNMLRFDTDLQDEVDVPISRTIGWLGFTHAITFGQAVHILCSRYPDLWPAGLAQLACFVGRNAPFLAAEAELTPWRVTDGEDFIARQLAGYFNHNEAAYIYLAHDLKLTMAVRALTHSFADDEISDLLLAALNRYLSTLKRRKAPARTAMQARRLVAKEGAAPVL